MAYASNLAATYTITFAGYSFPGYSALYTVILNLLVVIVLTPVCNALAGQRTGLDETVPADYTA
jgi:SSS family solute:Na+ symporter